MSKTGLGVKWEVDTVCNSKPSVLSIPPKFSVSTNVGYLKAKSTMTKQYFKSVSGHTFQGLNIF
jgi:hypothetical protein